MRVLLQRVSMASVNIGGEKISEIGSGFMILLGIAAGDDEADVEWLCGKIARMRVFPDEDGKMNRSILDTGGAAIVVSQFTLYASTKKGNRPSFLAAATPDHSEPLYENFCEALSAEMEKPIARGIFGADMQVSIINCGPVTLWLDSRAKE